METASSGLFQKLSPCGVQNGLAQARACGGATAGAQGRGGISLALGRCQSRTLRVPRSLTPTRQGCSEQGYLSARLPGVVGMPTVLCFTPGPQASSAPGLWPPRLTLHARLPTASSWASSAPSWPPPGVSCSPSGCTVHLAVTNCPAKPDAGKIPAPSQVGRMPRIWAHGRRLPLAHSSSQLLEMYTVMAPDYSERFITRSQLMGG